MPTVRIPSWKYIVNKRFWPLYGNTDRYLLLWGSRNSSKSESVARLLILRCLEEKYFRWLLIRKVSNTVKDSMYTTIKDAIYSMGLESYFTFCESPLEIRCYNGNKFLCRGLDEPAKIKSVKDPSGAWYEEANQITEKDFTTVTTSIRSDKARFLQEILTFNPDCQGDYEDFWIYKKFYKSPDRYSFRDQITVTDPETGQVMSSYYSSYHSTWRDNVFVKPADKVNLLSLEGYYKAVYADGKWGRIVTGNEFYNKFQRNGTHCKVEKVDYLPGLPVHISLDFNVLPYMTGLCAQVQLEGSTWHIRFYKEYCMKPPNNSAAMLCAAFVRDHGDLSPMPSVFYYGDASGERRIPGYGNERAFDEVRRGLLGFIHSSSDKVYRQNPGVFKRRDFINNIFGGKYDIVVHIDYSCVNLIIDLEMVMTTVTGKEKKRVVDEALQATYEQYGHCGDAMDYFLCKVLAHLWPYR